MYLFIVRFLLVTLIIILIRGWIWVRRQGKDKH